MDPETGCGLPSTGKKARFLIGRVCWFWNSIGPISDAAMLLRALVWVKPWYWLTNPCGSTAALREQLSSFFSSTQNTSLICYIYLAWMELNDKFINRPNTKWKKHIRGQICDEYSHSQADRLSLLAVYMVRCIIGLVLMTQKTCIIHS